MNSSTCKTCGAPILWAVTASGAKMPLDEQERNVLEVALDPDTHELQITRQVRGHESHFATCPDAAEHRKPAKKPCIVGGCGGVAEAGSLKCTYHRSTKGNT